MTHALKTWIEFYELQQEEVKLFELRRDDRPYNVNDRFLSQEYNRLTHTYTGRETLYVITYVLRDSALLGLQPGYCILQLKPYIQ